ncbi:hypothetical protein IT084_05380 [Desulfallas sp. Bu1-1]|jgi:hypothetical protein|uniref:hypothetical protein n=1 Tax=Desulfallas sp. Bu1-1 TaxID=2787620 RepID=UPI00189D4CAA|nr:hypothetical protein [Desulfallas sp. Bu1-1]MBF7082410.1 hypothetical protein [Desulfallas sp. Bu1-1]
MLVIFTVNNICFLTALLLYLYFRGSDAKGMYLAGSTIVLCAITNSLLLLVNQL